MALRDIFIIREMTFEEAWEAEDISPKQAQKEIERHQLEWADFVREVGVKDRYTGAEILAWLGY